MSLRKYVLVFALNTLSKSNQRFQPRENSVKKNRMKGVNLIKR